jgi:hypothetical protein
MGAWGTGPLENDAALDFVDEVKRAREVNRASKVQQALDAYCAFDARLRKGENVSVRTDEDVKELHKSRTNTLEWYESIGEAPPVDVLPELASEESWAAFIEELDGPETENGSYEAFCAIAAGHLILQSAGGRENVLSACDRETLVQLAALASRTIALIQQNALFEATWPSEEYGKLSVTLDELANDLGAVI